jgi:hypothetical protein
MDALLLPMILLAAVDKPNQKALFTQILPAMIPGQQPRLLLATVSAKKQIAIQTETEGNLVKEAVKAGNLKSPADLDRFPALLAAFNRLPASIQSTVFPAAPPRGDAGTKSGGNG